MNWMILVAIIVAGTISSMTDWFFMGVLFRDKYQKYPDTWWPRATPADERGAIICSSALGYITATAIALLCVFSGVTSIKGGLIVAALAAVAGPLVTSPTNGIWIKVDPVITAAHTAGYFVRFLIAGIATGFALS